MEELWLTWAKRVKSLASTGLHFGADQYDLERYREIDEIASQMLSMLGSVPVSRIESLLTENSRGYTTPKVDVRAAVFNQDEVLLVQEASDSLWTLPGGFADIGRSPVENVVKEVMEEAAIEVEVKSLYSVRHKAKHHYAQDARDFYKLFFICEPVGEVEVRAGIGTKDAQFFSLENLPPLSTSRVIREDIEMAFARRRHPQGPTLCD